MIIKSAELFKSPKREIEESFFDRMGKTMEWEKP